MALSVVEGCCKGVVRRVSLNTGSPSCHHRVDVFGGFVFVLELSKVCLFRKTDHRVRGLKIHGVQVAERLKMLGRIEPCKLVLSEGSLMNRR